jgi:hypothetical protein
MNYFAAATATWFSDREVGLARAEPVGSGGFLGADECRMPMYKRIAGPWRRMVSRRGIFRRDLGRAASLDSGEDRTAIELFIAGVQGWKSELQRFLNDSAGRK